MGLLKTINFPFGTNGKLMVLSVPILKHFRVFHLLLTVSALLLSSCVYIKMVLYLLFSGLMLNWPICQNSCYWNSIDTAVYFIELQGSKFSFRQTCPAGQVLPKTHLSLRKINLPCFSGVKMKKLKINHCFFIHM